MEDVKITKSKLNKLRIKEQDIKSEAGKLGEETVAVNAEDVSMMFAGKLAQLLLEQKTRATNTLGAFKRSYGHVSPEINDVLQGHYDVVMHDFDRKKLKIMRECEMHPLWDKLGGIKGLSSWNLATLISEIKDIARFDTPTKLCVYAGIASINDWPVTKGNLNKIKEFYLETKGKEFKGFNTKLSGRLFVLAGSMFKAQGWFYKYYLGIKDRLVHRAINNDEIEKRKDGVSIMKGKKNQPLKAWAHDNAQRRMIRTFLHMLWTEWRTLNELEVRAPYAVDYLGHKEWIKLDEVLTADGN